MRKFALLPLVLLASGCDKGDVEMKNASVDQVAKEMRKQGAVTGSSIRANGSRKSQLVSIDALGAFPTRREARRKRR